MQLPASFSSANLCVQSIDVFSLKSLQHRETTVTTRAPTSRYLARIGECNRLARSFGKNDVRSLPSVEHQRGTVACLDMVCVRAAAIYPIVSVYRVPVHANLAKKAGAHVWPFQVVEQGMPVVIVILPNKWISDVCTTIDVETDKPACMSVDAFHAKHKD